MSDNEIKAWMPLREQVRVNSGFLVDRIMEDGQISCYFGYAKNDEAIESGRADVLIAVLSQVTLRDEQFLLLLDYAMDNSIRILPVIIEQDLDFASIPDSINSIQWIELWDTDSRESRLERLMRAIKTDFVHLEQFRAYEREADAWLEKGERPDNLLRDRALTDAEGWLLSAKNQFPRPTDTITRFIKSSRQAADAIKQRNQRILRFFWSIIGLGACACIIMAAFIFRDALRIREAEREAERREQQSQDLIAYMVGELDEQLTQMGEFDLLADIVEEAQAYVDGMELVELNDEGLAFKEHLESLISDARGHLKESQITDSEMHNP